MKGIPRPAEWLRRRVVAATSAVLCLCALTPDSGRAATKTWTAGGTTVTWDDSGNWTPAGAPTTGDDALLPLGSFGLTGPFPTITLGASSVANSLVLENNYTLTGGALTLTTGSVYADLGVYAVVSSTLSGTAGLVKQGSGAIRLSNNANNYTGTTNIADGVVIVTGQGALGSSSSTVRITDQNFVPSDQNVQGYGGGALFFDARAADIAFTRNIDAVGYGPTGGRGGAITTLGNANLSGLVTSSTTSLTPATLRTTRFVSSEGMLTFSGTLSVLGTAFTTFTQLGTTNQAGTGLYTLSGALEGTGSLEKTGAGTLFLTPATTAGFSGAIRASASISGNMQSTIRITSPNVLGTRSNTNIAGSAVLDFNGGTVEVRMDAPSLLAGGSAANAYYRPNGTSTTPLFIDHALGSAVLSGTLALGRLDYDEGATATLSSRNGYSLNAGTSIASGGGDSNFGFANSLAGLLTFGGTGFWGMANSISRTITISGNGNTLIATNVIASNTTAGVDHILTKSGSGLLTITGTASTLDGAVNVQGGALAITDFRAVTNNSGTINLGSTGTGASLIFGTTVAPTAAGLTGTNKVINLAGTTGGGNIYASQSGANPVIINFLISGSGSKTLALGGTNAANNIVNAGIANGTSPSVTSLAKVGPGTWVLSGTNTYTGATTISDGTLKLQANTGAAGVLPDANAITFAAAGTGYAGGTLEYAWVSGGTTTETLGALTPTDGANTIKLTPGSGTAALVFASLGTIGSAATVNIVGSSGSSTVSFTTLTNSGTLVSPQIFFSGSNFALADANKVLKAPTYGTDAGFVTSPAAATIGSTAQSNFDITGAISAQTSSTASTLRMAGNQSLALAAGATLTLRSGAAGTTGGILATGGTSTISGGSGLTTGGTGALVIRVDGATDQLTISSTLASVGTGGFNKTGAGLLILSGSNLQTGTTNISEGTLRLSGVGRLSGANMTTNIRQGATLDVNGVGTDAAIGQFNNQGTVTNSSATPAVLTVGNNSTTGTSYGIVQDGTGKVSVTKVGTGAQSWLGLSTYTGTTTIGSTGLVTVDVLADIGVASGIGRGDATSDATNAASLVFNGSTGGLVYQGILRPLGSGDPSLALGSTSASTNRLFTLAGTAAGSGATLSSSVSLANAIVWSNTAAIAFGPGAASQTLVLRGASTGDNTFNPKLTDNGVNVTSLTKQDAGQWNVGGLSNTYSGSTTINEGILAINASGALPSTSPLVLAPTSASSVVVFQASGVFTRALAASAVSGSNSVTFAGTTASTTGGVGFAAHGTSLVVALGGTASPTPLTWGTNGFVGTGTTQNLVLNGVTSLAEVDFRNPIDLGTAARVVNVQDNTNTGADYAIMSGALSGAGGGSLRKIGTGILQLTGANTYTGTTSVEAGTLMVRSFGSSTDAPNTATSLGVSGTTMTDANAVTIAAVNLIYTGAGETTDRKIRLGATGALILHGNGSGPLVLTNVANDAIAGAKTLTLRGSSPVPNMITGTLTDSTLGGALTVQADSGGAIWILTGSNTYTGATTIAGPLGIGNDSAFGTTGTVSIQNGSSVFAYGGDRTVATRTNFTNSNTAGFYGDYNLTFTNVAINASSGGVNVFNNIAPGKALTLVNPFTGDLTANRTWTVNGAGTTIVTGSLTAISTTGTDFGLVITKNGDGTLVLGGTGNNFNRNGAGIDVDRGTLRMGNSDAIRAQAGDGGLTLSPEIATFDTATFDVNGTSQTINALAAITDGTIVIDNSSASDASFTFGANDSAVTLFTSGTGTYRITDSGAGRLSIVKAGNQSFTMISGVTLDYSGTTAVTGGGMTIASAVAQTSALAVSGTGSLLALTGGLTNPALITNVSVGPGSTLNLLDGVGSAITSLSSLSLGVGGTAATVLRMNFGDSGTDTLGLVGGTLALGGTDATSSVVTFDLTDVGASGNTRYDLITSSTGGLSSGTYTLGATPGGFTSFSLVTTDTAVYAMSGDLVTGSSFWTGSLGTAWNSGTANWSTDQAGTIPATSTPGSGSDVVFVADPVTTTGTLATTLEQSFRINSLVFQSGTGGTPSTVTIGPGAVATNRLDVAPQLATGGTIGITMTAGGPTGVTISAPFKLGAAQTWNVAGAAQTLTLSGPLLGEATVTKTGPGTVTISGTADPTFNSGTTTVLTVASGNLAITNVVALGSTVNDNLARIDVSGGGFYYDNATGGTVVNPITLSGGSLSAAGNNHTYSGVIPASGTSTINLRNANGDTSVTTARNITLPGDLSGTGRILVLSSTSLSAGNPLNGWLTLSGSNVGWSGGLEFQQGSVTATRTTALGTGDIAVTGAGGRLVFQTTAGAAFTLAQNFSLTGTNAVFEWQPDNTTGAAPDLTATLSGTLFLGNATSGTTGLRVYSPDAFSLADFTGPVVLGNDASITYGGGATLTRPTTFSGVISETGGSRSLSINDNFNGWTVTRYTVLLSNSNTYTGGTKLGGGVLRLGNAYALGTGPLSVTGNATLDTVVDVSTAPFLGQTLTLAGALTTTSTVGGLAFSGTTVNAGSGGITNNVDPGTGTVSLSTVRLADATTARTLTIAGTGATVIGTLVNNGTNNTLTNSSTGSGSLVISTTVFLSDSLATGRTLTVNGAGTTVVNGLISDADGVGQPGTLAYTGSGILSLTGSNAYTGGTQLGGATLLLGAKDSLGSGTLAVTAASAIRAGANLSGANAVANPVSIGAFNLTFNGTNNLELSGAITATGAPTFTASGSSGAVFTLGGAISAAANNVTFTGTVGSQGVIAAGLAQTGDAADVAVTGGTWTHSGGTSRVADVLTLSNTNTAFSVTGGLLQVRNDVIVDTGAALNLGTTGGLSFSTPTLSGDASLRIYRGGVMNFGANNPIVTTDFDQLRIGHDAGAVGAVGTLNTNGFNVSVNDFLGIGFHNADRVGIVTGLGTIGGIVNMDLYRGEVYAGLAGTAGVEKFGSGTVTLGGDNSGLTGSTNTDIQSGTLILDYRQSNTPKLRAAAATIMRGATLTLVGSDTAATAESVSTGGFTLASGGASTISLTPGAGQSVVLHLGGITRNVNSQDGTIRFVQPAGPQTSGNGITTTTVNASGTGANASLGGWATVDTGTGVFFAATGSSGTNNVVAALTLAQDAVGSWTAGVNVTDSTAFTGTVSAGNVNSLRFNAAAGSTVTVASGGVLGVASGGVLVTSSVGGAAAISGGSLVSSAAAATPELIFTQDDGSVFDVGSRIGINSMVFKSGTGTLRLSGANNYSGLTEILEGTLQIAGGNAIGDQSLVTLATYKNSTLELLASETIGRLSGGQRQIESDYGTVAVGSHTLTINQSANTNYAGFLTGSGTIVLNAGNTGNLNVQNASTAFTGAIAVNGGLLQMSNIGQINASAVTITGSGNLLLDNDGSTRSGTRLPDTTPITLHSAAGAWSSTTVPRGLAIRTNQNAGTAETVGAITFASGANYMNAEADGGTSAVSTITGSNFVRQDNATLTAVGRYLGASSGARTSLRIATSSTAAFVASMVGGSGAAGSTTISIVPWAIGASGTHADLVDINTANSLLTYDSTGLRPLDLVTEYSTYATAGATNNVRESLAADLTGLAGRTLNALVVDRSLTATGTTAVAGSGAGQSLVATSGAFLFTTSTAATAGSVHGIALGGFDDGIAVGATNEYVISVVNPSTAVGAATLTTTISSPLTTAADLTKSGRGTLILSASNTAGGGARRTTLNEGILEIADLDAIGGGAGDLVFAGGTLRLGAGFTDDLSTRSISFRPGGGTLNTNGVSLALANTLGSGAGGFTKAGVGTLTLNATATYTGATTISGGTIVIGANDATGVGGDLSLAAGTRLDVGTFSISHRLVSTAGASPTITGSGTITASAGFSFNHSGNTQIDAVLAGAGGLTKAQTNALTLTGANTYTGPTEITSGTVAFNSLGNVGGGPSALGGPTSVENGVIRLGLTTNATTLSYTGTGHSTDRVVALQGTTGGATFNANGSGAIGFGAVRGAMYGVKSLTLGGTAAPGLVNTIALLEEGPATLSLVKSGSSTWRIAGAGSISGSTQIDAGILRLASNNLLSPSAAVRIGTAATAGTLDLDGVSQSIGSLTVSSSATGVTNRILIPTGQTLTVNGSVLFGIDASAATTRVTGSGGGAFVVSSGSADFLLGLSANSANANTVIADFSGLGSFTANLGTGVFRMGDAVTGIAPANATTFTLATDNTITAAAIRIGESPAADNVHSLILGSGSNSLNADSLNVGLTSAASRSSGSLLFGAGDTTGTVRIRGSDGTSRSAVNMINTSVNSNYSQTALIDFGGHASDILASTWIMASRSSSGGSATGTFSFSAGTFDVTTLRMAERTSSGSGSAIATVNLGGGTSTIGSLAMAVNTSAGGTSTATFNVSGGAVSIGTGGGTAVTMATASADRTSISTLNLTGGTVSLTGDIVRSGSGGTETATIALAGGVLDLGGFGIGSAAAPITLDARSGGLGNLAEINGGAGITKTTSGTLTLFGANSFGGGLSMDAGRVVVTGSNGYTGATTIAGGTLALVGAGSIANSALVSIAAGAALDIAAVSGTATVNALSGSGNVALGGNVLRSVATASGTFAGVMSGVGGGFTKLGSGTLSLTSLQDFTGPARVDAGTLAIGASNTLGNASLLFVGEGAVLDATAAGLAVAGGQTLGGYGTVGGDVVFSASSFLSPGGSVGQLDGVGNATFTGGMTYVFEINDANGLAGTSPGWDLYTTTGDLTLDASAESRILIDMASLDGSISGTAASFNPTFNYAWKFVVAGQPISSFNAGWFHVDSSGFQNLPANPERFYVARGDKITNLPSFSGGTSSELYVVYAAIPEPSTVCLAACGLLTLGLAARRRRRPA